jgi:hypothetical protein
MSKRQRPWIYVGHLTSAPHAAELIVGVDPGHRVIHEYDTGPSVSVIGLSELSQAQVDR